MKQEELPGKVKSRKAKIGVIGLGYVGLPLAVLIASKGFYVKGFVRRKERVNSLNGGKHHLSETSLDTALRKVLKSKNFEVLVTSASELSQMDIIIICVPTPVDKSKKPHIEDLKEVAKLLSSINVSGKLIINESTVSPFMTREVLGNMPGDYFLVCSPERVDPGNKTKTTENIPKVVGGINKESITLGKAFYEMILKEKVVTVDSLEAAEMSKMLENTYRAVNIALINEFAKLADNCGIDILDVIKAASTKWSFHPHFPGIGVGGHCIPVDPYYILELGKSKKVNMDVVEKSLEANEQMPHYVLDKLLRVYKKGDRVVVYGITYKKNVNDLRESPSIEFCNLLKEKSISFKVYDPYVSEERLTRLGFELATFQACDIFIVGTDHDSLLNEYKEFVSSSTVVVDGRNFFNEKIGKMVIGIGRIFK